MKPIRRKIKEKFFHPTPLLGQLKVLVRQANVDSIIQKAKADKHSKKFKTTNHLYTMLVAVICQIKSLRNSVLYFTSTWQYATDELIKMLLSREPTNEIQLALVFK